MMSTFYRSTLRDYPCMLTYVFSHYVCGDVVAIYVHGRLTVTQMTLVRRRGKRPFPVANCLDA